MEIKIVPLGDVANPSLEPNEDKIKKMWSGTSCRFYDLKLYEFNLRRSDGLFQKLVFVFTDDGKNITSLVRSFLDIERYSKNQRFYGAMMNGGYGYHYYGFIVDALERKNYKSYKSMIERLIKDGKVRLE